MAENEINIVINATDKASSVIKTLGDSVGKVSSAIKKLTDEYSEYGDQVKTVSRLNGIGLDEASRMIQVAGDLSVSYDELGSSLKAYSKYVESNNEQSQKMQETADKYADEQKKSQEELSRTFVEIAADTSDKLSDLAQSHADRLSDITQSIKELEQNYTDTVSDNRQELSDKLSDMDQDYSDNREDLIRDLGKAETASQANSIKERISELDRDYKKRRARAIRDANQAMERAKREQDQKLALAKKRIQEENKEYQRQTEAIKLEQLKQEKSAKESFDRQAKYAADAYAKQFASLKSEAKKIQDEMAGEQNQQININSIAALSKEYLALPVGIERTNFALERFGKNGTEMMKILDLGPDKILTMSQSIQSSLIIDENKAKAIENNKNALNDFNKSMQALRFKAAGKLLEIFTSLPEPIQNTVTAFGALVSPSNLSNLADLVVSFKGFAELVPKLKEFGLAMKGIAVATWAAVGPVLAVGAAIIAVSVAIWKLIEFAKMLFGMFQQAAASGKLWEFIKALNGYNVVKNIKLPGRASGGPASGLTLVGERGPELVSLPQGSYVNSNSASQRMMGGGTLVLNYSPMFTIGDRESLARDLEPMFDEWLRRRR